MKLLQWAALCFACVLLASNSTMLNGAGEDAVASGVCGENCIWELDAQGTLTISGTGAMENYYLGDAPWYTHEYRINRIVVEDGVTSVGNYAFCDLNVLTEAELAESVTAIGRHAFGGCELLSEVVLNEGLTTIGLMAFYGTDSLKSLYIPSSVTEIENLAFACEAKGMSWADSTKTIISDPCSVAEQYAYSEGIRFTPKKAIAKGDLNQDGIVDVFDLVLLKRYLKNDGIIPLSAADVDENFRIDIEDVIQLNDFLLTRQTEFSKAEMLEFDVINAEWEYVNSEYEDGYIGIAETKEELHDMLGQISPIPEYMKTALSFPDKVLEDHVIILTVNSLGSGSRNVSLTGISRKSDTLTVYTNTISAKYPTPDMSSLYTLIAVKREDIEGIEHVMQDDNFM